jgi:serine/threonine protein kinase
VDVYSLGAVVFRTLGGRPPFTGTLAELLRTVRAAPRPSLRALRSDLPADVDDWAQQALAADREERFQSVRALWTALVIALRG